MILSICVMMCRIDWNWCCLMNWFIMIWFICLMWKRLLCDLVCWKGWMMRKCCCWELLCCIMMLDLFLFMLIMSCMECVLWSSICYGLVIMKSRLLLLGVWFWVLFWMFSWLCCWKKYCVMLIMIILEGLIIFW